MKYHKKFPEIKEEPIRAALERVFSAERVTWSFEGISSGPSVSRITALIDFNAYKKQKTLEDRFKFTFNNSNLTVTIDGRYLHIDLPVPLYTLYMGDIIYSEAWEGAPTHSLAIGRGIDGDTTIATLEKVKHILIAGQTGSGKSVFMHNLIISLLTKSSAADTDIYMIDPKGTEYNHYNRVPFCTIFTDLRQACKLLNCLCDEMNRRYAVIADAGCRDITGYNKVTDAPMKRTVVFIDELSDLIMTCGKEAEDSIVKLAQKARACGIHLIIATQYPIAKVVTGLIKNNMPTKVCLSVATTTASVLMLGRKGAEMLVGNGDMYYQTEQDNTPVRLQSAYVSDDDLALLK